MPLPIVYHLGKQIALTKRLDQKPCRSLVELCERMVVKIIVGVPNSTVAEETQLPNGAIRRIRLGRSGASAATYEVSESAYEFMLLRLNPKKRTLSCRDWILEALNNVDGSLSLKDLMALEPPFTRSTVLRGLQSLKKTSHISIDQKPPNGDSGRPARLYKINDL